MKKIGLTGSIGSGKSTVLNLFKEKNVKCIDADVIAREVLVDNPEILEKIKNHFGTEVIDNEGKLDRKKLGAIVFDDEEELYELNRIMQPYIVQRILRIGEECEKAGDYAVVYDIPLLLELGLNTFFDKIWVVAASEENCLDRIVKRNGLTREEAKKRYDAQMPVEEKISSANTVIFNDGDIESLKETFEDLWRRKIDLFVGG